MNLYRIALLALPTMLTAACATGNDADAAPPAGPRAAAIDVFRATGGRQCEDRGESLSALEQRLAAAGVRVESAACGTDGRMYPSVCGAPDGRIGIFAVPADQLDAARRAGFQLLSELPDAQRLDCE